MNLRQLEAFYWLTQLRNYQRVAEKLNVTQPAISARITALEAHLGTALVDRSKAQFDLTDRGHDVRVYAERMLDLHDSLLHRIDEDQRRQTRVSLAAIPLSVMTWLPDMVRSVEDRFPGTVCDVYSASDHQVSRHIENADVDLAFLSDASPRLPLANLFEVTYEVRWMAHPDLLDGARGTFSRDALSRMPLIQYPRTSPLFPLTEAFLREPKGGGARHTANALGTIVTMLKNRMGIAAIPAVAVAAELAAGDLTVIPVANGPQPLKVACAHANMARRELVDQLVCITADSAFRYCRDNPEWCTFADKA